MNEPRKWAKKNIKNYIEIYIKADLKKIIRLKKKKIYMNKKTRNIVGLNINPELPKTPNIIIYNNFKNSIDYLSKKLIKKIKYLIK